MPSLDQHQSTKIVKALIIAESGKGKTGALAALANAGYKLRIQDFDNGLDALRQYTKPECLQNVEFVTLTDKLTNIGGNIIPVGAPTAYSRGIQLLDHWRYYTNSSGTVIPGIPPAQVKDPKNPLEFLPQSGAPFTAYDFGKVADWGPDTILVIDSLTFQGNACLRYILALANHSGKQPFQSHWGQAMDLQEKLLDMLYAESIKCHVLVLSHVTYIPREEGTNAGYPSALGTKLPPKVPRYFNAVLEVASAGVGTHQKRTIRTASMGLIQLKNPVPAAKMPLELPIETGLADYFRLATNPGENNV